MDESFFQSATYQIVSAAITVAALLFAFYSHIKNTRHQKLGYNIAVKKVMRVASFKDFLNLDIKLAGTNIKNDVSIIHLLIFNKGKASVDPANLSRPICIELRDENFDFEKDFLLESSIIEVDQADGNFSLLKSENKFEPKVEVKFSYFPPKSGVFIKIITNLPGDRFFVSGSTKDFGNIRNMSSAKENFIAIIMILLLIPVFLAAIFGIGWIYFEYIPTIVTNYMGLESISLYTLPIRLFISGILVFLSFLVVKRLFKRVLRFFVLPSNFRFLEELPASEESK